MTLRANGPGPTNSPWLLLLAVLSACSATPESDSEPGPGASGSGGLSGSGGVPAVGGAGTGAGAGTGGVASGAAGTTPASGGSVAPAQDGGDPGVAGAGGADAGATNAGADGGSAGTGSTADPSCQGGDQVELALVGWATEDGGTTGGQGGTTIEVSTGAALVQALEDKQDSDTPLTILVSGVLTEANSDGATKFDVKDVRDVSIIGKGAGAELNGIGIKIVRAGNIVIRNLKIHEVLIGDKDAISIEGPADHIWIDHCELYAEYQGVDKDYYDGLLDAKAETEYLTYSWNYLHDSWKTALVGSSEDDTFDRKLTMHHNRFVNCNSRLPLFRGGNGHVFNNYYQDIVDTGVNSRLDACLRIEANYFEDAHNPWVSAYSDMLGGGELSCNVLAGSSDFEYADDVMELPTCVAEVPYDYADVLNHPDDVPAVVEANAGVGKLTDPTDF
jgi:pectate lyase